MFSGGIEKQHQAVMICLTSLGRKSNIPKKKQHQKISEIIKNLSLQSV